MNKISLLCVGLFLFLAFQAWGQGPVVAEYDSLHRTKPTREISKPQADVLPEAEAASKTDFRLQLFRVKQYMQSAQLIFELTNHTDQALTNFWVHVSLLDRNGQFLYREEPLLFVNLQPGQKAYREMLCESVGIEEIGHVVVYPQLLELEWNEVAFEKERVVLEQNVELPIRFAFYSAYTW